LNFLDFITCCGKRVNKKWWMKGGEIKNQIYKWWKKGGK
jgi:hypothetical protein